MEKNYVVYHLHSMLSNGVTNIDSVTKYTEYIDYAKSLNMKALAFSEHGCIFEWVHKKEYIEKCNMKYIHSSEVYLTEDNDIENKHRDNYHCVLIARNYDGVKELNKLISNSFNRNDYHYYYVPRITFDELFNTSDNIIITSSCLGGVLNNGNNDIKKKFLQFLIKNKHRSFLEIQHHNCKEQISYNKMLYTIHQKTNIPLIAGTDTHCLNDEHVLGRSILQKSKDVRFENEEMWDLTFKTYDELVKAYEIQNSLPKEVYIQAIENTNIMADMIEPFELDYSHKYPKLYSDSEKVFKDKILKGIKKRGIDKYNNFDKYKKRIQYELDTYKHNGAIDFMLLEEDYKSALKEQGVSFGYSRGSISGSVIAYILGITEVDSIKYNLNFERFMNQERVSLADVDTDWGKKDRYKVRQYLFNKKGLYCCDIITFNTIALKGAIKDIGRALGMSVDETQKISDAVYKDENKADCIDEEYKEKYPELFKYVDIVKGTIVSIGNHPAGLVVSPYPVDEWFGLCSTKTNEHMISQINMKEIDGLSFVKLDVLGLDCVGLINDTCDLANIPRITPDNISFDDIKVWNEIREDCTMIFQFESSYAGEYIKQLFSNETIKNIKSNNKNFSYIELMAMANGAIRPAGASYRDELSKGIYRDNGHKALNDFLSPTLGFCIEENQNISILDGNKKIKDINIGDIIYTKNGESIVENKIYTGKKECVEIITQSNSIICTKDHKLFSEYGWKKINELKEGDCIAVRVNNNSTKSYPFHKLKLIGYLLGDGILSVKNTVGFVNQNIDVINDYCNIISLFENTTASVFNRKSRVNKLDLYYVYAKHIVNHKTPTAVAKYLMDIGLKYMNGGCVAQEKFIPDFVFKLNKECLLTLLGAYTDTDCCIKNYNSKIAVYKTSSEKLKDGLIEIIRLCGYIAICTKDIKANAYAISVNNAKSFLYELYDYSYKVRKTYKKNELENSRVDVSNCVSRNNIINIIKSNGTSLKKIQLTSKVNLYQKQKYISVYSLRKINEFFPNLIPDMYLDNNIKWIKIEKINNVGIKNVYDLTIKDEHNFICQGFIAHNCVYQEQVIEFLNKFCGYTMGEADLVRRHFAKRIGTEEDIPKIKKGFINTMKKQYSVNKEESEKLVTNFIQVIIDASNYLFSLNHAIPYSFLGYAVGYLRCYYKLETVTTALNTYEEDNDKCLQILDYANRHNIKILPIKFGKSLSQYTMDKENNNIYKGISCIKYCNSTIAEELMELSKNKKYNNFVDLLYDIKNTSVDSRQLKILIILNFFSDFGNNEYLLKVNDIFDKLNSAKILKKSKIEELGIEECLVKKYSNKETATQYRELDNKGLINAICSTFKNNTLSIKEQIKAEMEYLGYTTYTNTKINEQYYIVINYMCYKDVTRPYFTLRNINNGEEIKTRITQSKVFKQSPFGEYSILKVEGFTEKFKKKNIGGSWVESDEIEKVLDYYEVIV